MYNKICMLVVFSCVIINLNAMDEDKQSLLLPENSADAARALDEAHQTNNYTTCFVNFFNNVIDKKDLLQQHYDALINTKKKQQNIQFPTEQEGYLVNTLTLHHQSIKTVYFDIPAHIQPQHLHYIDIAHNELEDLPLYHMIQCLPNLEKLNASHNKLAYVSLFLKDKKISKHGLRTLHLNNNQLKDFNLEDCFALCPNIIELDLSENPLKTISWPETYRAVYPNNQYPKINLQGTSLSEENKISIKKKYIKHAHHDILDQIGTTVAERVLFPLIGLPMVNSTWVWTLDSSLEIAAVMSLPTLVTAASVYYFSNKYYKGKKQDELNAIEAQVPQYLLFDTNDSEYEVISLNENN